MPFDKHKATRGRSPEAMKQSCRRALLLLLLCLLLLATGCAITPEPFDESTHWQRAMDDKALLYARQEPLDGPLSLPMAIARALTYNYDHRLALMEGAFQQKELTVANLGMLPKLSVDAGYNARDKESASRSISYFTRKETLEPSVSQERRRATFDISFNWSVLDFGISYFQAKQQADRYLIMEERRKRVINNIVKDVINAYWRAAMAETALPEIKKALDQASVALASYRETRESGLTPLLISLNEEKTLLQMTGNLRRIAAELEQARVHLAALTNLPMHTPLELVPPAENIYRNPPLLSAAISDLEDIGLKLRPDLREDSYQERIDKNEAKKEIVRMIPGVSILASKNYDENIFLHNNWWYEATARVSSNLLGLIANYAQHDAAKTQIEVAHTRRLANMIAALVQIHLAFHQYHLALADFRDSMRMSDLEHKIFEVTRTEAEEGSISKVETINRHTDMITAKLNEFHAIAGVSEAWSNLYFSIGGSMVGDIATDLPLEEKARRIETGLSAWWSGSLPGQSFIVGTAPEPVAAPSRHQGFYFGKMP